MRVQRYGLFALAIYLVIVGASTYYSVYLPVRVVTHALLTGVLLIWLIVRIRRGRCLPVTPLNWPLIAGAVVMALSVIFSTDPRMAAEHAWWPLVHGLMFFVFAALVQQGRQRLLFEMFFLISAITVLLAGQEFYGWAGNALTAVDIGAFLRGGAEFPPVTPMLSAPLHASTALAGFVTPQILIAFAWAGTVRQRTERVILAALGVALGLVLLGTGSRGGFLSLAAGAVVFLGLRLAPSLWALVRGEQRSGRAVLLGFAIAVLIIVTASVVVLEVSKEPDHSSGDIVRAGLWNSAIAAAQDHPLLGMGPGQYGRALRLYRAADAPADFVHRQAHNIILNTAAEEGIAGVLVLGAMAAMLLVGWYRQRRAASGARALRLDAVLAALVAAVVQLQFDVFFTTPYVAMLALLAAYAVVPAVMTAPRKLEKAAAWGAAVLVAAYGLFWIPVNLAHGAFEQSVREGDRAAAERAASLDPGLHLYPLQTAYLTGVQSETSPALLDDAIAAYESALALEPTWDTGWINLAGLYERAGRIEEALAALDRANAINPLSAAAWNRARIAGQPLPAALPAAGQWVDHNFEGVLYGRDAGFTLLPGLTPPGA